MRRAAPLLVVALGLVSCGPDGVKPPIAKGSTSPAPVRGGVLRLATYTDLRTLDAATAFDEVANVVEQLLYMQLVTLRPDGGVEGDLAESFTRSDDALTYTFRLREGVRFHDGSPVSAADVKRSLERALSPDTPCPVSSFYERIDGYADYVGRRADELRGVRVVSDHVVEIHLSEPDATLLSVLALPIAAVVCPSAGRAFDRSFSLRPCGSGPFRLERWEPGQRVVLRRFEGYHRPELPYLDGIVIELGVPPFTQRFKFESGEQDMIRDLTYADYRKYVASPDWRDNGVWEPAKAVHSIFLNTELPPFDRREVRRAVAFAIDRDQIAKVRPGVTTPATRLIPPAVPGHDPTPGQRHDLDEALRSMARAGYAFDPRTGKGGYPEEIDYVAVAGSFDQEAAELYQQQLAKIGIRIRLKMVSWSAYLAETARRGTTKMGSDGWAMDFPDPSDFFEPILSSKAISDEDSQNRAFFSDAAFDALLAEARREPDPAKRLEIYHRAEQRIIDEVPWVMSYYKRWYELFHGYVHGYTPHPSLTQRVRFVWLDGAQRRRLTRGPGAPRALPAWLGALR